MIKGNVKATKTKDLLPRIRQSLATIASNDVLVGITEEKAGKRGDINNAQLCYIQTHGVRSGAMAKEMDQAMIGPGGIPYTIDYDKFMANLDKMPYPQALALYVNSHGKGNWRIPPRPIIEPAIENPQNKKNITDAMKLVAQKALDGDTSAAMAQLSNVGKIGKYVVDQWFINPLNRWAPNAPSTIKRKGSDRPLIATAQLRQAMDYVIKQKGGKPW